MKSIWLSTFSSLLLISICHGARPLGESNELGDVRIVPLSPTPEPEHVKLRILFPERKEIEDRQPVEMQIRIDGFPLGVESVFPRRKEIFDNPQGQSIHIMIDNDPYFAKYTSFMSSMDESENYYEQTLELDIPELSSGEHVVRIFPARSFNESLKGDGCFQAETFYVKSKTPKLNVDLKGPYLTYNEPQGTFTYNAEIPILLDFYLTNCELSQDGYKVRLSIDGKHKRLLTEWRPFAIYGLKKGSHTVRLELLDARENPIPGTFNDTSRKIIVK